MFVKTNYFVKEITTFLIIIDKEIHVTCLFRELITFGEQFFLVSAATCWWAAKFKKPNLIKLDLFARAKCTGSNLPSVVAAGLRYNQAAKEKRQT